jgi:hypothetical protein
LPRQRPHPRGHAGAVQGGQVARVAALAAALAAAGPALAYAPARTPGGAAEHWPGPCVAITVHLDALPGVTPDQARAAALAAARAWSRPAVDCTGLDIALSFAEGPAPRTANDGQAVIGARTDPWCTESAPARECASPSAVAATSVFARDRDGVVMDADIQLNTVNFTWSVADQPAADTEQQDLQAALTHELGHVLGFQHPCWSGFGPRANDDRGQPVPDCYDAPDDVQTSVMFPSTTPGDVSRRILSADDRRGVCATYPPPAVTCPAPPAAGCAVGGRGRPGLLLLVLLTLCRRRTR